MGSSARTVVDTISQPSSLQRAATDGPERSSYFPAATESLMVTIEIRMGWSVGLFFGGRGVLFRAITLLFIDQPQRFHQEARGCTRDRAACGASVEIDFEFTVRP